MNSRLSDTETDSREARTSSPGNDSGSRIERTIRPTRNHSRKIGGRVDATEPFSAAQLPDSMPIIGKTVMTGYSSRARLKAMTRPIVINAETTQKAL